MAAPESGGGGEAGANFTPEKNYNFRELLSSNSVHDIHSKRTLKMLNI